MAYNERALRGVGGWLAFFILTLGVFSPLRGAIVIIGNLNVATPEILGPNRDLVLMIENVLIGGGGLAAMYAAWRLATREDWQSVRIAIFVLWTIFAITVISIASVVTLSPLTLSQMLDAVGVQLAQTVGYATIWTLYLLRSRRVRNTYASTSEEDAEVFA